jgi:L-fuconolactonase
LYRRKSAGTGQSQFGPGGTATGVIFGSAAAKTDKARQTKGASLSMQSSGTPSPKAVETKALEPDLPIIDPHHHLYGLPHPRYLIEEFSADLASGHNVLATVYVECSAMYRKTGPEALRPVGEAEYVAGLAAMSASGFYGSTRICAGFVGAADFTLGDKVDDVLDALAQASGNRLRGIRGNATWDADPTVNTGTRPFAAKGLLLDSRFRDGVKRLAARNLVYDAWQYHPQMPEVASLADAIPSVPMVVNHCGGLLGISSYARADNFANWKALVTDVAKRPNVLMKLGGLSGPRCGFGYKTRTTPPTDQDLAKDWRPYIETCIELFGVERCMFESNFPPDKISGSYGTVWNAFKIIASGFSADEKKHLFSATAQRTYRID